MAYDFSSFKKTAEGTLEWLKREFAGIRTGRATPSVLDVVTVRAYGNEMPINQLATVMVEGPKSLRIAPWDKTVAQAIDLAIRESNLGLSVSIDDTGLRVSFPDLTADRRTMMVKVAKEKFEEARITLRAEREKVLGDIDRKEKADEISEDEKFRYRGELQKLVDDANKKLEEMFEHKEKEIQE